MDIRLPPDQEARVAAFAASAGRSPDDIVQEAVAQWVERQVPRPVPAAEHTPAEAVARILELRKGNVLPDGETIKDLINYGRA